MDESREHELFFDIAVPELLSSVMLTDLRLHAENHEINLQLWLLIKPFLEPIIKPHPHPLNAT